MNMGAHLRNQMANLRISYSINTKTKTVSFNNTRTQAAPGQIRRNVLNEKIPPRAQKEQLGT
jgi:hypothetical protein